MARRLEPHIGYRMSRAALSKAERSLHGGSIRRFDADEIVGLARIFELPVGYFFVPPEPHFHGKRVVVNGKSGNPRAHITSPPLSRDEMIKFSHPAPEPPHSEAERRELDARADAVLKVVFETMEKGFARAMGQYLETRPAELASMELARILNDPGMAQRIAEGQTARPEMTAVQEQKLAGDVWSAVKHVSVGSEEGRMRKRDTRPRRKFKRAGVEPERSSR